MKPDNTPDTDDDTPRILQAISQQAVRSETWLHCGL